MPPPPPPRPPKKKANPWLILGIIAAVLIIGAAINNTTRSSPSAQATPTADTVLATDTPTDTPVPTATLDASIPTSTPAPPPKWTTTHTFTGNGIKKTAIFSVPDDWKILWSCKANSFYGSQYNVQVYVYNSDSSIQDIAINELCKTGNTSGETEEHQSGDIYLEINSEAAWTVQVQEFN